MVKTIGDLLNLPNLEEETIKTINETLRYMVKQYAAAIAPVPDIPKGLDPFADAKKQASHLLGETALSEWLNGPPQKEGE